MLSDEQRASFLAALHACRGRLKDAIEASGLDPAEVLALTAANSNDFDPTFAGEVAKLERVRLLDMEETLWHRAEKGSTAAAQELSRRKSNDGWAATKGLTKKQKAELGKSTFEERKKANGKAAGPDPVAAGATRLAALTSGRE